MLAYIQQLQFAVDGSMATLIWLVQLVIYPAFRVVVPDRFCEWHAHYVKMMARVVIPLMVLQAACHGVLLVLEPSLAQWGAVVTLLAAWGVTFTLSVPCHQRLQKSGYHIETINRLIQTNWLRTFCWSLTLLLGQL